MGALSSQGCIMLPKANPSPSPGRPVVLVRSSSTQPVPLKPWFLEWHHDARSTLVRNGKMALYGRLLWKDVLLIQMSEMDPSISSLQLYSIIIDFPLPLVDRMTNIIKHPKTWFSSTILDQYCRYVVHQINVHNEQHHRHSNCDLIMSSSSSGCCPGCS